MIAMQPSGAGQLQKSIAKAPYRFAHTVILVRDLAKSLSFYCDVMRMTPLRRTDHPTRRFINVFVGFGKDRAGRTSSW